MSRQPQTPEVKNCIFMKYGPGLGFGQKYVNLGLKIYCIKRKCVLNIWVVETTLISESRAMTSRLLLLVYNFAEGAMIKAPIIVDKMLQRAISQRKKRRTADIPLLPVCKERRSKTFYSI